MERTEATRSGEQLTAEQLRDRIAQRAYQLYEARGGVGGYDVQDWLQAEHELLTQLGYEVHSTGAKAATQRVR
jgi:outer membrane protein TolC